jgi:hypothetical protein
MPIWQKVLIAGFIGGTVTFGGLMVPTIAATITSVKWFEYWPLLVFGYLFACAVAGALYYKDKDPRHIWTEEKREEFRAEQAAKV